jgi:hypothetical protein
MGYEQPPPPPPPDQPPGEQRLIRGDAGMYANLPRGTEQRAAQEQGVGDTKRNLADLIRLLSKLPPKTATSMYAQAFPAPLHAAGITVVAGDASSEEIRQWAAGKELEALCAEYGFQARVEVISAEQLSQKVRDLEVLYQEQTGKRLNQLHPDERWKPVALGRFLSDHPWTVVITRPAEWVLSGAFGDLGAMLMGALFEMRRRAKRRNAAAREEAHQDPAVAAAILRLKKGGGPKMVMPEPSRLARLVAWLRRLLGMSPKTKPSEVAAEPVSSTPLATPQPWSHLMSTPAQHHASSRPERLGDVLVFDTRTGVMMRLNPATPPPEHAYVRISRLRPGDVGGLRALAFDSGTETWLPPS